MTTQQVIDNKYRVLEILGEGGMGIVYKAEHVLLRRKVALKILHERHSSKPAALERFLIEAQAAGTIGHPNIVEVQDIGKDGDRVYMVMELLTGGDLSREMATHSRLSYGRATGIMLQVLSALHAAHRKGIVHRDLKPDNIFIATDPRGREEIKLLDFGVAKIQRPVTREVRLTQTGTIMGTPVYMSPEQAGGEKDLTPQIDIWSCGVILYYMISGELPFDGENYNEVLKNILLREPPLLSDLVPDLPRTLSTAVSRAMAKDTAVRYRTVREMIQALMPFHDERRSSISPRAAMAMAHSIAPTPDYILSEDETRDSSERTTLPDGPLDGEAPARSTPTVTHVQLDSDRERVPSEKDEWIPGPDTRLEVTSNGHRGGSPWSRFRHRRKAAIFGIGFGLISIVLAVILLPSISMPPSDAGSETVEASRRTAAPAAKPPPKSKRVSLPEKPADKSPTTDEEDIVELEIRALVEGAVIKLNGEEVPHPIRVPRSTDPLRLEVVDGRRRFLATVIPDESKQIEIQWKPEPPRQESPKPPRRRPQRKGTKPRLTGDFASNPF